MRPPSRVQSSRSVPRRDRVGAQEFRSQEGLTHAGDARARALPPGPSKKAYLVELVLQAEFPRPTGFYRWADPASETLTSKQTKEAVS